MSNNVWPALPIFGKEIGYEPTYRTIVHQVISGREDRSSPAALRRQWTLIYTVRDSVLAPNEAASGGQDWSAYTERQIVAKFHDDHLGSGDSFLFRDPFTPGAQRRVRFASDLLKWKQMVPGIWQVEIDFIECLSGDQSTEFTFDDSAGLM